jgi:hypothetical protein
MPTEWMPRYTMAKLPLPMSFRRRNLPTAMEGSEGAGRVMTGDVDLPAMAGCRERAKGIGTTDGRFGLLLLDSEYGQGEQQQEAEGQWVTQSETCSRRGRCRDASSWDRKKPQQHQQTDGRASGAGGAESLYGPMTRWTHIEKEKQ